MYILIRYAIGLLLSNFAVITIVLSGVVWLSQSMRILDLIVTKGISFIDFFKIAALMLPSLLFFLLPITYLLATIYLIYKIRQDRELIILKSIGIDDKSIVMPVFITGCCIALFNLVNAAYIMPTSHSKFKYMNDYFQNEYSTLLLQEKTFNTQGKLTVYLDSKNPDGSLNEVFISDAREAGKSRIISAARGIVRSTKTGPVFELFHGVQHESSDGHKVSILSFDKYVFNLKRITADYTNRARSPVELTMLEIIKKMPSNPNDRKTYYSVLHQRITWPLLALSLPLLASVILVKAGYKRKYPIKNYVNCLLLCSSFIVISILANNMIHSSLWWIGALYAVSIMPFSLTAVLLKKDV